MENKKIYTVDTLMIVATLIVLIILVGYSTPRVIAPIDNNNNDKEILFSINKNDKIQLDNSINFENPKDILLTNGQTLDLNPGIYYLRISSENLHEIRKLEIKTTVSLTFIESQNSFDLVNSGDTSLIVQVHDKNKLLETVEINPKNGGIQQ